MEFFEAIERRRSIRAYRKKKIEEEKIKKLLEVANSAPSAGNLQAYQIFLVKDEDKKKKLVGVSYDQEFIALASVVLVFCAAPQTSGQKYGGRGQNLYSIQDATISCAYVHLAAVALGLGSVFVGAFDEEKVKRILGIPPNLRPIVILPVGYPDKSPEKTPRLSLKDLVKEI
ncbi:MAG: nitroreductase [candidate division Zixibacteria bacterium SM23_73_2]|nr:MAG: nitroreductase [candidate division Zixibacteria bacterium SM23_73_2]